MSYETEFFAKCRLMLVKEEGYTNYPYDDATGKRVKAPIGKLTVGVGHNIDAKLFSKNVIELMLNEDIDEAEDALLRILGVDTYRTMSINRQVALTGLVFQIGEFGFRKVIPTIALIRLGKWEDVAIRLRASLWAKQTPERAERVIEMIEKDIFIYEV